MINKDDIKLMPFTFIIAPILLVSLTFVMVDAYQHAIHEKELIVSLSCPELKKYAENQVIESKLYFGSEVYLSYAEKRYQILC